MDGLWKSRCFQRWQRKDLLPNDRVFGSRFHHNIKRDGATGQITNCKVQLVVQGNRMKEGKDYVGMRTPANKTRRRQIMGKTRHQQIKL
eukprot:198614-Rhodomonas_salina.1